MATARASPTPAMDDVLARRLGSVLSVAREHRTGLSLDRLTELLPTDGPRSNDEVTAWLAAHPDHASVVAGRAFPPLAPTAYSDLELREARGRRYLSQADRLCREDLAPIHALLASVSVTGSTAYGAPEAGDDLDFLTITRPGSMWVVLAFTFLRLRLGTASTRTEGAAPACFNFVLEEPEAIRDFRRPQGLLFARESLMARPVFGEPQFRSLIHSAAWMRRELPRLYGRWDSEGLGAIPATEAAPIPIRLLNAALFLPLAAYLQLQGLVRNWRFRRRGEAERSFRTVTGRRRLAYASSRFEALRRTYAAADAPPTGVA
jgi:hypothetical protein